MMSGDIQKLFDRSAHAPGPIGGPRGKRGPRGKPGPRAKLSFFNNPLHLQRGAIFNVWSGGCLLGIVNEQNASWAKLEALRLWPDRCNLRAVEAALDPFRAKTLVRAAIFAYPQRVQ